MKNNIRVFVQRYYKISRILLAMINNLSFNNYKKITNGNTFINQGLCRGCRIETKGIGNII